MENENERDIEAGGWVDMGTHCWTKENKFSKETTKLGVCYFGEN